MCHHYNVSPTQLSPSPSAPRCVFEFCVTLGAGFIHIYVFIIFTVSSQKASMFLVLLVSVLILKTGHGTPLALWSVSSGLEISIGKTSIFFLKGDVSYFLMLKASPSFHGRVILV